MVFISIVLITQILHTMHNRLSLAISRRPLNWCDCLVNRFVDQLNSIEEKRAKWSSSITAAEHSFTVSFVHSFALLHHPQPIKNRNTHKQLLKHNECFVIIAWYSTRQPSIDFVFACVRVNVSLSCSSSSFQIVVLCEHLMWCRNRF